MTCGFSNVQNHGKFLYMLLLQFLINIHSQNAGLKTLVISGDTNLRNVCMSASVPAVKYQALWEMLCDRKMQRAGPEMWIAYFQKQLQAKMDHQSKHHRNQQMLRT